jgi:PAS domain S-box-containing protein
MSLLGSDTTASDDSDLEGAPTNLLESVNLAEAEDVLRQLAGAFPIANRSQVSAAGFDAKWELAPLPEVDARYQTLVEQIPAVVFLAFLDRGIGEAYVSPQIESILGFSQDEWLQDPVRWYQQLHPDDKARWSIEAADLFLLGKPLKSLYRVISRDGRTVWFHCEVKMVRNSDGRPWFIHGVAFDISELKTAEEALKKSEEMWRGLFESAPDTVVVIRDSGEIISVNAQVGRMFGYSPNDIIGKSITTLISDPSIVEHLRNRSLGPDASSITSPHEFYGIHEDRSQFPIDIMLNPMVAESSMIICVIRDITMRKSAEESLRNYAQRLKFLSSRLMEVQEVERRNIALELHDEIGQVLTGLKLTLEVSTRLPVEEVGSSINRARDLVNELMARVRNLSLALRPAMLDDLGLLPTLLWHIENYTAQTKVKVNFKHHGLEKRRFTPQVETAAYRLVQEALTNVARHAEVLEATVRLWTDSNKLSIQVEDFGKGFDPDGVTERDSSGLAGMRERAALLGGQLKIESRSGAGTRLIAELNVADDFAGNLPSTNSY